MEKKELFARVFPFWEDLSPQEQEQMLQSSMETVYPKGTVIHRSEQGCKGIMLLYTGQLRAYIVSEEGREVTLYRVYAGEACVMAASCLMDAIVFDILIEAIDDTRVLMVPAAVLSQMMQNRPEAELFLYKTASERFSDVMWTMQQILFMGADRRVAIFLWDEYVRGGDVISLTHDEIARYIGSAREVVTKVLKYFVQEGIVSLGRGRITVTDKEKLRARAEL